MRVFIQAVPWHIDRARNAWRLAEATGGTIVWDRGRNPYKTFLRVLETIGDEPAWVIEDDVDLCDDFTARAAEVADTHPDLIIRAFSLGTRTGLVPGVEFYSTVCTYYPAGAAAGILAYAAGLTKEDHRREALDQLHDHLVGLWLDSTGQSYWLHTPSLVQHRIGPSLIDPRGRDKDRRSPTFTP